MTAITDQSMASEIPRQATKYSEWHQSPSDTVTPARKTAMLNVQLVLLPQYAIFTTLLDVLFSMFVRVRVVNYSQCQRGLVSEETVVLRRWGSET